MFKFLSPLLRRRRTRTGAGSWFNYDAFDEMFERSAAPWILTFVMVWSIASVLLLLSFRQHRDVNQWKAGEKAPYPVMARTDFQYVDSGATEEERLRVRQNEPEYFRIDAHRSSVISRNFSDFFLYVETRIADLKNRRQYEIVQDSLPSRLTGELSPTLLEALGKAYLRSHSYETFQNRLRRMISRGILSETDKEPRNAGRRMRTIDVSGRLSMQIRSIGEYPAPGVAAELLAAALFPEENASNAEFRRIAIALLGSGNLNYDMQKSHEAAEKAAASVVTKIRVKNRGDLLVSKGQTITPEIREMLLAEHNTMPNELVLSIFYYRVGLSFLLLLFTAFFLYRFQPELMRNNRKIMLLGAVTILGLLINYGTIALFDALGHEFHLTGRTLLAVAVPVALTTVLSTVLIGYRSAICAGAFVVTTSAIMIHPDNPLELILRWMTFSVLAGLVVRGVTNYRTFFIRVLLATTVLTALLNFDLFYAAGPHELYHTAMAVAGSSFAAAIIALVLIFTFELLFNVTTDMSLMVLCDYNHPLLERLKREAPGTMFHSMTVATLAEDAARAIRANPLKAKAGALYHDIGKLEMSQYFTENNHDSPHLHLQLNPQMSSIIIRDHVKIGLNLAREYHLNRLVRDAIRTHHGDDMVSFFYAKALAEGRDKGSPQAVVESQFRYSGPPPASRELTIISLADACEAACRSIANPNPTKIRNMVDGIFQKRFQNGQLRRSELTLEELDKVRESFISTIIGIHHGRIAYTPEENNHDQNSPQLAESAPSGAGKR